MNVTDLVRLCAHELMVLVLVISGAAKLIHHETFEGTLRSIPFVPARSVSLMRVMLPVIEIALACLLLTVRPPFLLLGIIGSFILMLIFVGVGAMALVRGMTDVDCACFGALTRSRFGLALLLRNLLLAATSAVLFPWNGTSISHLWHQASHGEIAISVALTLTVMLGYVLLAELGAIRTAAQLTAD